MITVTILQYPKPELQRVVPRSTSIQAFLQEQGIDTTYYCVYIDGKAYAGNELEQKFGDVVTQDRCRLSLAKNKDCA